MKGEQTAMKPGTTTNTMKAILWDGEVNPVCRDVPVPVPDEGEVLLKVLRAGICGTDLSILGGKHPRAKAPLVLGHELAARVASPCPGVAEGALVTIEPIISCRKCVACRGGFPHVCSTLKLYGIDLPGGMAEYIKVAADRILPVRKGMDPDMVVLA